jgi:hypothetical protein
MLSKWPENDPIGHKGQFKLCRDPTLVKVELQVLCMFWSSTFNKSCGSSYVEQTLLKGQELVWHLTQSNRAHKIQSSAVLEPTNLAKS